MFYRYFLHRTKPSKIITAINDESLRLVLVGPYHPSEELVVYGEGEGRPAEHHAIQLGEIESRGKRGIIENHFQLPGLEILQYLLPLLFRGLG